MITLIQLVGSFIRVIFPVFIKKTAFSVKKVQLFPVGDFIVEHIEAFISVFPNRSASNFQNFCGVQKYTDSAGGC